MVLMASIADFQSIYQPSNQTPVGFSLADLSLDGGLASVGAGTQSGRILRNFSQFDLPDLVGNQAARGAFHSSATSNKANRLATGAADQLGDIQTGLAPVLAQLATNGVLAQTGVQL